MKLLKRISKILIALLLIPFCIGAVWALWEVVLKSGSASNIWFATLSGAFVWVLIYIFLPKPNLMYVFGHELTHAIWTWAFLGRVKRFRFTSEGGHVLITKSNFLTTLAPYFFPFYVVLVIIIFSIGNFFYNWSHYILWFYFFIGMMYAFHITLTKHILKTKQPDIIGEGYIFSAVIIFLGNILILLIGIPLLTKETSMHSALSLWLDHSAQIYSLIKFK